MLFKISNISLFVSVNVTPRALAQTTKIYTKQSTAVIIITLNYYADILPMIDH